MIHRISNNRDSNMVALSRSLSILHTPTFTVRQEQDLPTHASKIQIGCGRISQTATTGYQPKNVVIHSRTYTEGMVCDSPTKSMKATLSHYLLLCKSNSEEVSCQQQNTEVRTCIDTVACVHFQTQNIQDVTNCTGWVLACLSSVQAVTHK